MRNQRLVQHCFDDESLGQFKFLQALGWAEPFPVDEFLCLEQHAAGFMKLVIGCTAWFGRERLAKREKNSKKRKSLVQKQMRHLAKRYGFC